jgi:hypothetical protein
MPRPRWFHQIDSSISSSIRAGDPAQCARSFIVDARTGSDNFHCYRLGLIVTYFPYLRGKQFELIALRESATLLADTGFTPIIEPVRSSLNGLKRALDTIVEAGASAIVVVNPHHGDHNADGSEVQGLLADEYSDFDNIRAGILLQVTTSVDEAVELIELFDTRSGTTLIHAGFADGGALREAIAAKELGVDHVFLDHRASDLYRRRFTDGSRVLIRDGFEKKKNAEYGPVDHFSDLHVVYADNYSGYGDYLTVGDTYSESGGPAYAVAIHMTYIDHDQDESMFVRHFVSETNDTPTDPAGKFREALSSLMAYVNGGSSKLELTSALEEFRQLHERQHFPGLGHVKKLSMKHHLETLKIYHADVI